MRGSGKGKCNHTIVLRVILLSLPAKSNYFHLSVNTPIALQMYLTSKYIAMKVMAEFGEKGACLGGSKPPNSVLVNFPIAIASAHQ